LANARTIARLEARILERAAYCLEFEVKDPRVTFVTITRVELAKDLSVARVFYSVLGSSADKSRAAHMLKSASGFVQRKVGRVLKLRRVPRLMWIFDESIERAANLDRLIKTALDRDRKIQVQGTAPEEVAGEDWEAEYEGYVDDDEE
jgi:ribosome-binding factor A